MDGRQRFRWFLGIDVSKETFDACCLPNQGEKVFNLSASMDRKGFEELIKQLSALSMVQESVLVGVESTACYHINLYSFLVSLGYPVVVINPLLISNFVKLQLRKTKTDKKDASVIAQFLLLNRDSLSQTLFSSEISDLRDLSRQRESLVDQMSSTKSEIKRLLSMTFPELEHISGIFTKSMLRLLCQYPSAVSMKQAKRSRIAKILIPGSYGKQTNASVDRILKAAQISIGTSSPTKEIILKQKASLLTQLEEHLQELTDILIELCQGKIQGEMDILTSMKGIGEKSAANFLVEMGGDMKQFGNHKKVIAMAGLDPALYQSGKIDRKGKISKRGNRHLRRVIWLMTTKVIQFNERFKQYYLRRIKEGLPYKKAVLATAHKLIRVIFAMLRNKTLFDARMN
ncbi:MAG: IS110 family transposase [Deltaproteobacteria bacterium]|nr:IS110 family transposase [Deltaproteobacteria bacterium]